jgi:hypothetical protein
LFSKNIGIDGLNIEFGKAECGIFFKKGRSSIAWTLPCSFPPTLGGLCPLGKEVEIGFWWEGQDFFAAQKIPFIPTL